MMRGLGLEWVKKSYGYPVRCRSEPDISSMLYGSGGRVEDGRGSLGPVASAPFPIPAHRTGDPDFRSPALRLASPRGTRRSEWQAFEAQQAEVLVDNVTREPDGATPCHLMPSCEEVAHTLVGIAIDCAECRPPRPVAEIIRPATQ